MICNRFVLLLKWRVNTSSSNPRQMQNANTKNWKYIDRLGSKTKITSCVYQVWSEAWRTMKLQFALIFVLWHFYFHWTMFGSRMIIQAALYDVPLLSTSNIYVHQLIALLRRQRCGVVSNFLWKYLIYLVLKKCKVYQFSRKKFKCVERFFKISLTSKRKAKVFPIRLWTAFPSFTENLRLSKIAFVV